MDIEERETYDVETAGEGGHDTHEERGNWGRHIEFVLATIGFAVGLGNVWRFPYLAQKNGGGAFLIPYFLCLIIAGIPIFFVELGIGQRLRRGSVACWNEISPYLGGIGIACMVVSFLVSVYYNMIVGWSFYYMFISMQEKLPYASCDGFNHITPGPNATNVTDCERLGSTNHYWYHENLQISTEMTASSPLLWHLCLVLLLAWVIVFAVMMKGLAAAGKVVYFTSLFPYVVLFIFLIRGLTLEGAGVGIKRMFKPDFKHLKDPRVWLDAATQIFFSLSLAFGGLVSMASYNPVHNNCRRDSVVVSLVNCFTSQIASLVVFSVLGFKATQKCKGKTGCEIDKELEKVASGAGLTFIAFTEAISQMPAPHIWAILFFMMLITLGFGSMFGTLEGVITPLFDAKLIDVKKPYITAAVCLISYIIGLSFCTESGVYWLELFDGYSGTIPLLSIAFFELIAVAYVYGLDKFERDIEYMLNDKPGLYWKICWKFLAPIFIIVVFFASLIDMMVNGIGYKRWDVLKDDKVPASFPGYAYFIIVLMILTPLACIPIVAVIRYFGFMPYKSRGAATIDVDDDDQPSGASTPNLSQMRLTCHEQAPGVKDDNDEAQSLIDHKDSGRESVL